MRKTHESYATIQGDQDGANVLAHKNHYTSEKNPRWSASDNLVPCRPRHNYLRSKPFPGAGEGIRTPDPLITNQMLYRLSYASNRHRARTGALCP